MITDDEEPERAPADEPAHRGWPLHEAVSHGRAYSPTEKGGETRLSECGLETLCRSPRSCGALTGCHVGNRRKSTALSSGGRLGLVARAMQRSRLPMLQAGAPQRARSCIFGMRPEHLHPPPLAKNQERRRCGARPKPALASPSRAGRSRATKSQQGPLRGAEVAGNRGAETTRHASSTGARHAACGPPPSSLASPSAAGARANLR